MNYELGIKNKADTKSGQNEPNRNSSFLILNSRKAAGFSLLETLVALAVLTAAVTGPMSLATVSIRSASLAHNNIIASFLAEEGIELVRARRDATTYADWLADVGVCTAVAPCVADAFASAAEEIISPCSGACPKMKYDSTTGTFSQAVTGNDAIFTRTISVNTAAPFNSAREAQVTVTVSWKERFLPGDSEVVIENRLFNWK